MLTPKTSRKKEDPVHKPAGGGGALLSTQPKDTMTKQRTIKIGSRVTATTNHGRRVEGIVRHITDVGKNGAWYHVGTKDGGLYGVRASRIE